VSGTNLTLVVGFLLVVARFAGVRARGLVVVGAAVVLGFVILARPEPSVLRAAAMGSVALLGMGSPGRDRGVRTLGVAVLVLLLQTVVTFAGAFLIPDAEKTLDFEWGATFSPRKSRAGGDFGGNALVATAATKKADLAASFLDFLTQEESMRDFCAGASLLPTRRDLSAKGIEFAVRPELSPVFVGQATTVRAADSGQVASPSMSKIITVLKDQLEQAFVGGQSTDATVQGISTGIAAATAT
jgi:hypothetical protein